MTSVTPSTLPRAASTLAGHASHVIPATFNVTASIDKISAENPADFTAVAKSAAVTLSFSTFTTAVLLSVETLMTSVTPVTLLSAACTFAVHAPHVIPVTASVTSSVATLGITTDALKRGSASTAAMSAALSTFPFSTFTTA